MDVGTSFGALNWLAILIATISSFVIGGVWYGPAFGRAWMKEHGFSEEDLGKRNMGKVFGFSLLLLLIAAINLAMFIGPGADVAFGGMAGFFAGFGWVSTLLGVLYLFEMTSLKLFFINAGYCTLTLTTMGIILGAF